MSPPPQFRRTACAVIILALSSGGGLLQAADFLTDMGYVKLETVLASEPAAMPRAAGVAVVHVEAYPLGTTKYLPWDFPDPSPGTVEGEVYEDMSLTGNHAFFQKVFTAESDGDHLKSAHAATVAQYFYSYLTNEAFVFASMAPDVFDISCFYAVDYAKGGYSSVQAKKVHCNAWIATGAQPLGGLPQPSANTMLRDLDEDIDGGGYLVIGAVNNGATDVPELLVSGYNTLAVGRSDGFHSTGGTPGTVDGAGRIKPEVVAPYSTTSDTSGGLSSLGALLYGVAIDSGFTNASGGNEVVKAVIMAGATKDETEFHAGAYTGWSRSLMAPLDARFGAGEINAYESYRILTAGEQAAGGAIDQYGWDYGAVPVLSPDQDYAFTIPAGLHANKLSIAVTWNRIKVGPSYIVHDLNLRLLSSDESVEWDRSDSDKDNVEHIFYRNLPSGDYIIRLTRTGNASATTNYGIAWRTKLGKGPLLDGVEESGDVVFSMKNLDPQVTYTIERASSIDPENWSDIHTFIPSSLTFDPMTFEYSWTDATAAGPFQLYRLSWAPPTN